MYHVFLDNVTGFEIDNSSGVKRVELSSEIYAGDAGRIAVKLIIHRNGFLVIIDSRDHRDLEPYISVDAQVLYAARLFGNLLK